MPRHVKDGDSRTAHNIKAQGPALCAAVRSLGSAQFGQCTVWAVRSPAVRRLSLLCYFPYGRVLDAELLEIRFELLRVVVVLPHLRPVLRHDVRVEPRGRLVGRREERLVLDVLRLD